MLPDNPIDSVPTPTFRNLREKAATWKLSDDVSLLQHLKKLSTCIISEVTSLNNELKSVQKDASSALSRVDKVSQAFHLLPSSQYVESRVYEDDDEETASKVSIPVSNTSNSREEKEEAMIPKLRQAFEIGMSIVQRPFANGNNEEALDPIWDYNSRPLPYLVGSSEFFQHPVPGRRICYENNNVEEGRIKKEEEKNVNIERDEEELSTPTSAPVCSDSDDDTSSRPLEDVPGVHIQVPNVPKPGFDPNITSVLPGRISPAVEEESDDLEGNSVLNTKDLLTSKETKPSGASGLFDDDSNPESDEDLFHPKLNVNKRVLLANGKVLHSGVSVFGPQPPKIVPPSTEPSLSQTKPIIPNISPSEPVNASQISKPKPKSLFDDDEEDLFAPIPAKNQAPKAPLSSAPKLSENRISTTTVTSKPVSQVSSHPEPKKRQSLFGDSDSEDDLFAPVKSSKPADFPPVISQVSAPGLPKVTGLASKTNIFYDDDEDDLFSPVKPSNVISQNNSKLSPSQVAPPTEDQKVEKSDTRNKIFHEGDNLFAAKSIVTRSEPARISAIAPGVEAQKVDESDSKKKILYEDDLSGPKSSRIPQIAPKSTPTSQVPAPPQEPADKGSKPEILYESDEDDLFSTKSMPKSDKLRVKDALSTAITSTAVKPIFEAQISAKASKKARSRSASPRGTEKSPILSKSGSPNLTLPPKKPSNLFDASDSDDDLFAGISNTKPFNPQILPEKSAKVSITPENHPSALQDNEKEPTSETLTQPTATIPQNATEAPEMKENQSGTPKTAKVSTSLFADDEEDDLFAGNHSQITKNKSTVRTEPSQVITTVSPPTPPQEPPPDVTNTIEISPHFSVSPISPISALNTSISSDQKERNSSQNTSRGDSQYTGPSGGRGSSVSPSSFVSPLAPGGNSDSEASSSVKSPRKPVGGVALFGGALLLGGKVKASSQESPSSTPSVFSGELPPVFTPVSAGPSFEGPSSIVGPSPDVLPTVLKGRAKIAAKRKPPSKRFRQQGLPTEDTTGDPVAPVDSQVVVEAGKTPKALESADLPIPESAPLPEDKSPLGSDSASLFTSIKEDLIIRAMPDKPVKVEIADSARLCDKDSEEKNLQDSDELLDYDLRSEKSLKSNENRPSNDSREVLNDSSNKPSKLASLFDSDDEDLFASLPARKTDYTKPATPPRGHGTVKSNLEQSSLANVSRASFLGDEDSEDDLFGTDSGSKKLEFSQKTPHESSGQLWKDVQEKPSKPKVSAALFNDDDSDEDLFSTKPNSKFPPVPRNTTAFTVPQKQPAPFKDPLLGSP